MAAYTVDAIVELTDKLQAFKQEFGDAMLERVKELTPVRTGLLQRSWELEVTEDAIILGNPVVYAEFVENGTLKMAPRSMLSTTINEASDIADQILRNA